MASVRIGSIAGIPVRLGVSFLLIVPVIAFLIGSQVTDVVGLLELLSGATVDAEALTTGLRPWVLGLAAALGLFLSVFLHELGHAAVARRYGVHIESITLWFLGGLAQFSELPDDWRHEFWIAIAGPVVSVALGVGLYAAFDLLPPEQTFLWAIAGYLAILNVALAAFNLLPGFPMDGGRILRALLSRSRSRLQATRIAAGVGKGFAVLLGIGGILFFNFFWIAIAFFIFLAATSETRQVVLQATFEGLTASDIMTPGAELDTVAPDAALSELLERMIRERHTGYPVVEDGELVGVVTLEDVQQIASDRRGTTSVQHVMSTDLVTVSPDTDATDALTTLQQHDVGRVLVTDENGLAGLLSRTDLMTVFEIAQTGRSESLVRRAAEP